VTALVPSVTACFDSSPGISNLTADKTQLVASESSMTPVTEYMHCMSILPVCPVLRAYTPQSTCYVRRSTLATYWHCAMHSLHTASPLHTLQYHHRAYMIHSCCAPVSSNPEQHASYITMLRIVPIAWPSFKANLYTIRQAKACQYLQPQSRAQLMAMQKLNL